MFSFETNSYPEQVAEGVRENCGEGRTACISIDARRVVAVGMVWIPGFTVWIGIVGAVGPRASQQSGVSATNVVDRVERGRTRVETFGKLDLIENRNVVNGQRGHVRDRERRLLDFLHVQHPEGVVIVLVVEPDVAGQIFHRDQLRGVGRDALTFINVSFSAGNFI